MRRLVPLLPLLLLLLLLTPPASAAALEGFGWPLNGTPVVDRGFEPPRTTHGPGHRGVDLRAVVGDRVLAAGPGRVSYAGLLAGRGVVTVLHAGGLRTTYEPVQATVHVGDQVERDALLGRLTTGHASCRVGTACLHWGLLRGQTYLDPLGLVLAGRVRLLPLGDAAGPTLRNGASAPALVTTHASAEGRVAHGPSDGLSGPVRGAAAVTAVGSLLLGTALLTRRPARAPSPPEPGGAAQAPVDLLAERRRRHVG